MTRSRKKNPFVVNHLLRKIKKLNTKVEKAIIKTWSKKSTILVDLQNFRGFAKIDNKSRR